MDTYRTHLASARVDEEGLLSEMVYLNVCSAVTSVSRSTTSSIAAKLTVVTGLADVTLLSLLGSLYGGKKRRLPGGTAAHLAQGSGSGGLDSLVRIGLHAVCFLWAPPSRPHFPPLNFQRPTYCPRWTSLMPVPLPHPRSLMIRTGPSRSSGCYLTIFTLSPSFQTRTAPTLLLNPAYIRA